MPLISKMVNVNNKLYLDVYDDVDLTNRLNKEGELVKNIIIKKRGELHTILRFYKLY